MNNDWVTVDQRQLQRELSNKKQEAHALMGEMDSIAQAFEEMQEQNIRLLQQLKVTLVVGDYDKHVYTCMIVIGLYDIHVHVFI